MKQKLAKALATAAALLMLASAAACGTGTSTGADKTLTIGTYMNITTLLPWKTTSDGDSYVLRQVYSSLIQLNNKSEYTPEFATAWESSDDGLTWTFHLRDDIFWHDGNELFAEGEKVQVTSEDVKFTFDYYLRPESGNSRFATLDEDIESVECPDPQTVVFHMKKADVLFENYVYLQSIIPSRAFDADYNMTFDLEAFPVGSGAYKFVEHATDTHVKLTANKDYYITPGLDEIIYQIIPDRTVAAMALQNGEVDFVPAILPTDAGAIADQEDLTITNTGIGSLRWFAFNCEKGIFADKDLRTAVVMAINLDETVEAIFKDSPITIAVRGYGPIPIERPGGANQERFKSLVPAYDPEGAKAIIESKGYTLGSNGIYQKDGTPLSFTIQVGNNDANRERLAVVISTELKKIGVDCTARTAEWATHLDDMDKGNLDMYISGGYSGLDGPWRLMSYSETSYSPNCGYKNDQVEELLVQASLTSDSEARSRVLEDAAAIFTADSPIVCSWFEYMPCAYNNKVTGFDYYPSLIFPLCSPVRNVTIVE